MRIVIYEFAIFSAICFCLVACKQNIKSNKLLNDTVVKSSVKKDTTKAGLLNNTEYMDWDSVTINGLVHMISSKGLLYHTIGKPDSIITPNMNDVCGTFFDNFFKFVYIKGSEFETRGDSIVVSSLNFKRSGLKLISPNLILDSNTTLESLNKVFPKAVKKQYEVNKLIAIQLALSKTNTDDTWILFFKDGELIEIDHHIDC